MLGDFIGCFIVSGICVILFVGGIRVEDLSGDMLVISVRIKLKLIRLA